MRQGLLWLMSYLLLTALNAVFLGHLFNETKEIKPLVLLFWSFLFVNLWFALCSIIKSSFSYSSYGTRLKASWSNVLGFQITTLLCWVGYFGALAFSLEPAIYGVIASTGQPVWTLLLMQFMVTGLKATCRDLLIVVGVVSGMFLLTVGSLVGWSAVGQISTMHLIVALTLSVFSGIGLAGNTIYSTRLAQNFSPSEILASRFLLLIIAAAWMAPKPEIISITSEGWLMIAIMASVGIAAPIYSFQRGASALKDPYLIALGMSCLPLFELFFQLFDNRLRVSFYSWAGVIVVTLFAISGIYIKRRAGNT